MCVNNRQLGRLACTVGFIDLERNCNNLLFLNIYEMQYLVFNNLTYNVSDPLAVKRTLKCAFECNIKGTVSRKSWMCKAMGC
jgi:hypothetical protein